jgi:hypothetical protein
MTGNFLNSGMYSPTLQNNIIFILFLNNNPRIQEHGENVVGNVVGKVPIPTKLVLFPTNIFVENGENSCSDEAPFNMTKAKG